MLERLEALLRRAPPGAPPAYWRARSRVAGWAAERSARRIAAAVGDALRGRREVRFAQVGSNDGVRGDPLRPLVLRHASWRGVFAEPVPWLFERLRRGYPDDPRLHFECVAVAADAGRRPFWIVSPQAGHALGGRLPSWHDQIGSLDAEHLVTHLGERIRPFLVAHEVECVTLPTLLARAGLAGIDLLHVDAEGADAEILRQLDLSDEPPAVVLFERAHLAPAQARGAEERLRRAGYRLSHHGGDTLALR